FLGKNQVNLPSRRDQLPHRDERCEGLLDVLEHMPAEYDVPSMLRNFFDRIEHCQTARPSQADRLGADVPASGMGQTQQVLADSAAILEDPLATILGRKIEPGRYFGTCLEVLLIPDQIEQMGLMVNTIVIGLDRLGRAGQHDPTDFGYQ